MSTESVLKKYKPGQVVGIFIHKDVWNVIWNKYLNAYDRLVFNCALCNTPLPVLHLQLIQYWCQKDYVELFETVLITTNFHPDTKKFIFTTAYLWFSKKILKLLSTSEKWEILAEELGFFTRHMIRNDRLDLLDIFGPTEHAYYILCVVWRSARVDHINLLFTTWKQKGWMIGFVENAAKEGHPILLQFLKLCVPHSLTKQELVACAERFFTREGLDEAILIIEESFQ